MSRIFEALKRSRGSAAEAARNVLTPDQLPALEAELSDTSSDESRELLSLGLDEFDLGIKSRLRSVEARTQTAAPLLPFGGRNSQAAEQYRIIRTKIVQHPRRPRQIVISSPESGDGKSVNSINLAGVLALNPESSVLLIDGDMHRSSLARYFDVSPTPGFAEVLSGSCSLAEAVVRIEPHPNFFFLPGGKSTRGPAELLDSSRARKLSQALRKQFSYVVTDAPPAGAVADFELLLTNSDGVVLVVRQDHTNRMLCMKTFETLPKEKLIGVILNCVTPWFLGRSLGYYHYYHYSKYYHRND